MELHRRAAPGSKAVIAAVDGREILDSRGHPTVEAEITLSTGARVRAAAPSGASTGKREAAELRDGGNRYGGRGVCTIAKTLAGEVASVLVGRQTNEQAAVDEDLIALDGTADKSRLGANVLLAASLVYAKASAAAAGTTLCRSLMRNADEESVLPMPMLNIINGGAHAQNNVAIQELMIVPLEFSCFEDALRAGVEVFHALKNILLRRRLSVHVGDEGGFAPDLPNTEAALDLLLQAIEAGGYRAGEQIAVAVDCAASGLYDGELYRFDDFCGDSAELVDKLESWVDNYPIVSIEDGCAEEDWRGWEILTRRLQGRAQIVGDDLFVTHPDLVARGIKNRSANALLVKPNQIGTLSETWRAVELAQAANWGIVFSHRSGDTEYAEIADLAVACNAGQIKTGAPCRGERTAKYNQLLRIADDLRGRARYADRSVLGLRP